MTKILTQYKFIDREYIYIHTLRWSNREDTVQYSTVQYSTVQYSTVQYSTVQYSTVQYSTVQYDIQYSTVLAGRHIENINRNWKSYLKGQTDFFFMNRFLCF